MIPPSGQTFPDTYYQREPKGVPYSMDLIAPGVMTKYSFYLRPFGFSPGFGIFYLLGRTKYPTYLYSSPPELPGPIPVYFRARDLGYQISLQSSFKVIRRIAAYSEFSYRFFKLPIPKDSNGIPLTHFDFDLSGPSASCGVILWAF